MELLAASLLRDLVSAVTQGDAEQVELLLVRGVPPDVIDQAAGWSALHAAVLHNPQLLKVLLAFARSPDAPEVMGGTPMSYVLHELGEAASPARRDELLMALASLLAAGASPRAGGVDQTPLELARLYRLRDIESLLSEAGQ
ncbi:ankyrin repeat domain-containing protein [Lysobacter sp. cf310]|uniref:ankyrin repeat domain-containing protein n=1 Tax=Lysobacter sp. cf310 TaxID=1761790 RepID=UPI0008EF191A|nr:ankyrin repeat domain-containing protein [Lysobacter sp. cf310]SFK96736.1 hypothetical protein SAMN04487938_2693 [Lysobacter sp. cf310]